MFVFDFVFLLEAVISQSADLTEIVYISCPRYFHFQSLYLIQVSFTNLKISITLEIISVSKRIHVLNDLWNVTKITSVRKVLECNVLIFISGKVVFNHVCNSCVCLPALEIGFKICVKSNKLYSSLKQQKFEQS